MFSIDQIRFYSVVWINVFWAFIIINNHMFLGFFERRDSVIFERYEMFASTLNEHFRFGHTFGEDVLQHYGYKKFVLIVCVGKLLAVLV